MLFKIKLEEDYSLTLEKSDITLLSDMKYELKNTVNAKGESVEDKVILINNKFYSHSPFELIAKTIVQIKIVKRYLEQKIKLLDEHLITLENMLTKHRQRPKNLYRGKI